jgi:hypothetical protein
MQDRNGNLRRGKTKGPALARYWGDGCGIAGRSGNGLWRLWLRAELDRSYIVGIEAGLRNPSIKAVAKIARGLGLTLSALLETVT